MLVRNKESGAIEALSYDAAMTAATAGTHVIVNEAEIAKADAKAAARAAKTDTAKADAKSA